MNNLNLDTLSLTEKWALLAKQREEQDLTDKNIRLLRNSISKDEADLAKKESEIKAVKDETQGIPPIPSPLEENNG